jgi:hypothetical protein
MLGNFADVYGPFVASEWSGREMLLMISLLPLACCNLRVGILNLECKDEDKTQLF